MPKKILKKDKEDILFAFIASFFVIIGFIVALIYRKDDEYVMHYAKQGLVIFIAYTLISLVLFIPHPIYLKQFLNISIFILWVVNWINSLSGKQKRTFLISNYADMIKI